MKKLVQTSNDKYKLINPLTMKTLIRIQLIGFILLLALLSACKKDDTKGYIVTYRIIPPHNSITKITYTDASGNSVIVNDYTQFIDGNRQITITKKPFNAKISVDVNNQTSTTLYYDLYIKIGEVNLIGVSCFANPFSISTGEAEYTIK